MIGLALCVWLWAYPVSAQVEEVGGPRVSLVGPLALRVANAFWLVAPLLAFNVALSGRLPEKYFGRERVPKTLLVIENILRVPVFVAPVLLPLHVGDSLSQVGWASYGAGAAVYLASWLAQTHFSERPFSRSLGGRLAPAYTPILWLLGIALITRSPAYGIVAGAFVAVHITHFALVFVNRE